MGEGDDKAGVEAVPEPIEDGRVPSPESPNAIFWEISARSDVGCVREGNEDAFLVADLTRKTTDGPTDRAEVGAKGILALVCDGMGGAVSGEVASSLAVDVVYHEMAAAPEGLDRAMAARLLRRAVRTANRRLVEEGRQNPQHRGMGTTLSGAVLCKDALVLAQIGDSRAYLYRSGVLVQVTRDQSVVSALLTAGRLTPEEAKHFIHANVILQALGVSDDVEVSLSIVDLRRGDRLLVCSDGLHGPIGDAGIAAALAASERPDDNAEALIGAARKAGGPDNITAVLIRFDGAGLAAPKEGEEDLPKFLEFDPAEEGDRSITTTSRVARRLAARAGVGSDPGPAPLPATGQHPAIRDAQLKRAAARSIGAEPGGPPAQIAFRERSRLGALAWVIAGVALLAVAAIFLWFRFRAR